jgi:thiamine-monophosphate kinase
VARRTTRAPGEFELIARLVRPIKLSRRTVLGPGDDTAVLAPARRPILFTIDSVVEGVHFKLAWGSPALLGARALEVNLSDIAAMGGVPTACVVNLGVRRGLGAAFFDRLYAGLRARAREAGVDIAGGNVTRAQALSITIALLGEVPSATLRRDAARAGDEIFVTGTVGDAAAGWRILEGKLRARDWGRRYLVGRLLAPRARLYAGRQLASMRPAPAAIDLSDGLLQDLGHILERSGVGAEIDAEALPLSAAYREVVGDDRTLALSGGEDYELLFCLRPGHDERALARRLKLPVRRIGRIVRRRGLKVRGWAAREARGWDQLKAQD